MEESSVENASDAIQVFVMLEDDTRVEICWSREGVKMGCLKRKLWYFGQRSKPGLPNPQPPRYA